MRRRAIGEGQGTAGGDRLGRRAAIGCRGATRDNEQLPAFRSDPQVEPAIAHLRIDRIAVEAERLRRRAHQQRRFALLDP